VLFGVNRRENLFHRISPKSPSVAEKSKKLSLACGTAWRGGRQGRQNFFPTLVV
jgi:hypothetical protein